MNDGTEEKSSIKSDEYIERCKKSCGTESCLDETEVAKEVEEKRLAEFEKVDGTSLSNVEKFFNFRPPVFVAIVLALGILLAVFTLLTGFYPVFIPACIIALFLTIFVVFKKSLYYFVIAVCSVAVFFIGFFGVYSKIDDNKNKAFSGNVKTSGEGVVTSSVKTKDGNFIVYLKKYSSYDGIYKGGVAIKTSEDFERGCVLHVSGSMSFEETTFDNLQPLVKGYDYFIAYAKANVVGDNNDLFALLSRRVCKAILNNSDESGGILVALVLGDTKYVDAEVYESFSVAGVAHIFAVSGLHIGFLAVALGLLLDKLKIRRLLKTLIVFILTLFYSGVCGFTVSSLRAVVMCAVAGVAKSTGVKYDFLNSIAFAFTIVCCIFPKSLFTYGTVLSFGSVTAIALLTKTFEDVYSFMPPKLCTSVAVSSSAFLGTFPLVSNMLGRTSVLTILLNLVTIPLVSVLFVLTFLGGWLTAITDLFAFLLVPSEFIARVISSIYGFLNIEQLVVPVEFSFIPTAILYVDVFLITDRLNFPSVVKKIGVIVLPFILLLFI